MPKRSVLLDISPSRLELAVVAAGHVIARRTHTPEDPAFLDKWPDSARSLSAQLRAWVDELGIRAAPTTILSTTPDAHAGILTVPAPLDDRAAEEAGRLALADALTFPLGGNPHAVTPLDRPGAHRPSSAPTDTSDAQRRLLGVADTELSCRALFDLAQDAGLRPVRIIPAAAAVLTSAFRRGLDQASAPTPTHGTTVLLHLGEHTSVLVAVSGSRVRFIRTFAVGLASFVEALSRPHGHAAPSGEAGAAMTRHDAQRLLSTAGIPRRDEVLDEASGLNATDVLPLLQPVLQRIVVELRQSLRFGLAEPERAVMQLVPLGFAAAMPRLAESIADLHGPPLTAAPEPPASAAGDPPSSATSGAIAAFLDARDALPTLLPRTVREARTARGFSRAVWAGAAAAVAAVAVNGVSTHLALRHELRQLDGSHAASPTDDPALALFAAAAAQRTTVAAALTSLHAGLGNAPDWSAFLTALAETTPAHIRLRTVDILDEGRDDPPQARIRAFAAADAGPPAQAIKAYLDRLADLPVIAAVRLGPTGRSVVAGEAVHEFELICDLVGVPADFFVAELHAPAQGGEPR